MDTPIIALAIEDDSADYFLLERLFKKNPAKRLSRAQCLKDGLASAASQDYDVILLDLSLPDSRGMDTVKEFMKIDTAPIVVLSGLDNKDTALESVQLGAQDYLVKGSFDAELLFRTIRYAIERHKLRRELDATRQEVYRERELRRLHSDALSTRLPPDESRVNEGNPLKSAHSEVFQRSRKQYSSILDNALEQRAFKVDHKISDALRELAKELRVYKATPRDIVEIHTVAITLKHTITLPEKNRVVNEEARYLLAGLLGHLCSIYRSDALHSGFTAEQVQDWLDTDVEQ